MAITGEEKQQVLDLQQQIAENDKTLGETYRTDNQEYQKTRAAALQRDAELHQQYEAMVSANPELRQYGESHPATQPEKYKIEQSIFSGSLNTNKELINSLDYQRRQIFIQTELANPNDSIQELQRKYEERVGIFNKNITNVDVNYEATLKLAQDTGIHQALYNNLPETYQKDQAKRLVDLGYKSTEPMQRYNAIQPVERGGLYDINTKAPRPKGYDPATHKGLDPLTGKVTPQNPRKTIETDQPDSQYANPNFQRDKALEFLESVKAPKGNLATANRNFFLGLSEPTKPSKAGENATASLFNVAPTKPKPLTDAQAAMMSPSEIDAYNRQVAVWNQYAAFETKQAEQLNAANKIIAKENLKNWQQNKANLLDSLAGMKKEGVQFLSIGYEGGGKTVPIDKAFYEIMSTKNITGIQAVPNLPEGYGLTGSLENYPEGMIYYPERKTPLVGPSQSLEAGFLQSIGLMSTEGKPEPYHNELGRVTSNEKMGPNTKFENKPQNPYGEVPRGDIFGSGLAYLTNYKTSDPILDQLAGYAIEGIGGAAILNNIIEERIRTPLYEITTGKKKEEFLYSYVPATLTAASTFTAGLVSGGLEVIEKRNLKYFPGAAAQAFENASKVAQEQGINRTIGGVISFASPFNPVGKLGKLAKIEKLPLEVVADTSRPFTAYTAIITRGGETVAQKTFKTMEKAQQFTNKYAFMPSVERKVTAVETPVKSFQIAGKNIISKVGSQYNVGSPTKNVPGLIESFKRLSPTGRGLEVGSLEKYGQDILTSPQGGYALVEAGKMTPAGVIELQKDIQAARILEKSRKYVKPKIQNVLTEVSSLEGSAEQNALFENVLPSSKVPIKGGAAQAAQVRKSILEKTPRIEIKDIDRDFTGSVLGKAYMKLGLSEKAKELSYKLALKNVEKAKKTFEKIKDEGRAFEIKGTKLMAGEADITKPTFEIDIPKGMAAHGTSLKNAKKIMREGLNPEARPMGEPAAFATQTPEIFERFSTKGKGMPSVVLGKLEESGILSYKKIPKKERKEIIKKSRDIAAKSKTPQWAAYQELLIKHAKEKGYIGVTKPYHSTNPNAEKYEIIFFEKGRGFQPAEIVKPTGFAVKEGTGKKVLENLSEKDELAGSPATQHEKVFGASYKHDVVRSITPSSKAKKPTTNVLKKSIPYRGIIDQTLTKLVSKSSIQGPRTEKFAGEGSPDFLKPERKLPYTESGFGLTAPEARLKDPFDYVKLDLPEIGNRLLETGSKKAGKMGIQLLNIARDIEALHPEIDWGKVGTVTENLERDYTRPSKISQTAESLYRGVRGGVPSGVMTTTNIPEEKYKDDIFTRMDLKIGEGVMRAAKIGRGDFLVGADVHLAGRIDKLMPDFKRAAMFTRPIQPGKIFIANAKEMTPDEAAKTLSHETLHNILDKMNELKASEQLDIIEYGYAKGDVIKKLAPSKFNEGKVGYENTIDILMKPSGKTIRGKQTNKETSSKSNLPPSKTSIVMSPSFSSVNRNSYASRYSTSNFSPINSLGSSHLRSASSISKSSKPSPSEPSISRSRLQPSPVSPYRPSNVSPSKASPVSPAKGSPFSPLTGSPASPAPPYKIPRLKPVIPPQPPKPPQIPLLHAKRDKERKAKEKAPNDFIGNTQISDINYIVNRGEITTGISRSGKIYSKQLGFEYGQRRKKVGSFAKGGSETAIRSRPMKGLLSQHRSTGLRRGGKQWRL